MGQSEYNYKTVIAHHGGYLTIKIEKSLQKMCQITTDSEYIRQFQGVAVPGSKSLVLVDNNLSSRGVGWRRFMGLRFLLETFGNSLGIWRSRCSQPNGDRESLDVCWRYLVEAPIGWDQSRLRIRRCGGGKKELSWDQGLFIIFGPKPKSVREVWLGLVLVQDIWSILASVEDVDAPTEVPGGQRPYECVCGR